MNPSLSLSGVAMNGIKIKQNKIWSSNQRNNKWHKMSNNLAVSLVIKILPVCYKKHPYHSYGFLGCLLLSSILTSTNLLTLQDKRELKSHVCSRQRQDQNPHVPGKVCECVSGIMCLQRIEIF